MRAAIAGMFGTSDVAALRERRQLVLLTTPPGRDRDVVVEAINAFLGAPAAAPSAQQHRHSHAH